MKAKAFRAIPLLITVFFLSSCGGITTASGSISYKPPFLPLIFSIDTHGTISIRGDLSVVTPVGTFSADANISASLQPQNDMLTLVIRHTRKDSIVDDVYTIQTGSDEVRVVTNGRTTVDVTVHKVFIDASNGSVQNIEVTDTRSVTTEVTQTPSSPATPTPQPDIATPTSQPGTTYPHLVSVYQGNIQNTTVGATATLALISIVQNQQTISGDVVIGTGLIGSGSFLGTMETDGKVSFTDTDTADSLTINFSGLLSSDGSLAGTYTVISSGQIGTWQTMPDQPQFTGSYPHLVSVYQGNVQNTTVGATATLTLTSIVQEQQVMSGEVIIGAGLIGSGFFVGTMETDGKVSFTDDDTTDNLTINFSGLLSSDGSLAGTYTVISSGQIGTWQATPS